jgi:hypothetical protein
LEGRLRFQQGFYDATSAKVSADVLICRHVIEHVADPCELLRTFYRSNIQIVVETPCLDWILRNQVFWDLFYEHCSLFTSESLARALS